jgi:uncharacterized membrane protein YqjE
MNEANSANNVRSLAELITEVREELKEFLNTRLQMIRSEIHESMSALRVALPLGVVALVLVGTGFLLFSAAIVTLVASAFTGNPYAWFLACIIVAVLWMILAATAAFFAYNELRSKGIFPKRTVEVLKADKDWIQTEARNKYGRAA